MKENNLKKYVILAICVLSLIFTCVLGTYAYFASTMNVKNKQEVKIDTKTMKLKFLDGNPTIDKKIRLGETVIKKFVIENTGDADITINIDWLDIVNTYTEGSLTYTLQFSEVDNGSYKEILSSTNVPITDSAFTTTLAADVKVPAETTYYYDLHITFNSLDKNQELDKNAKLTTKFTLSSSSTNRIYNLIIDPNGGSLGDSNTVTTYNKKENEKVVIGIPTKEGAQFAGWKISGYGSTFKDGLLTMGKSNTKVVAEWTALDSLE